MATAFGSYFDTATNRFGIDFVAGENNVFGIDPFPFVPPTPPPSPIAEYDFNFYMANSPVITNQVINPVGNATIHAENDNTYDTSDPANAYLTIFAPNNFPALTGGMTTPSVTIHSAEMWVKMDSNDPYGMYLVDFRNGLGNGFIIGAGGGGDGSVGAGWENQKIYYNTTPSVLTATTNPVTTLYNNGWFQVVLVSDTVFTDDCSFFCSSGTQQGMPISVADVSVYDIILTDSDIISLFNSKCSRYGLSPV